MNKKILIFIIPFVIIILIAGAAIYLVMTNKPAPVAPYQNTPPKADQPRADNNPIVNQPPPIADLCADASNTKPFISSLSQTTGSLGTNLEITGCNFSGFEGDKDTWIVARDGTKGMLPTSNSESTDTLIKTTVSSPLCQDNISYKGGPCENPMTLAAGAYKIYEEAWGEKSNEVDFTIQ